METKKSIRQIIRKQRKELDPMIWQSQTTEICRKTCELDIFREATDIYCYIDFGGEVGTRPLMLEAWKLGKTVWVPKVHGETMDFYEITTFDELKPGAYGILEPDAGKPASADDGLMINTELRDKYPSLDALCEDREITKTSITDTLKGIDYEYDNIRNQFV